MNIERKIAFVQKIEPKIYNNGEITMSNNNEGFQELSLFDIDDEPECSKKLSVVEAEFKELHTMNWEDLFQGFDELYAITYSSGIDFISRVLPNFRYAEIIFGCETVLEDNIAMVMSVQFSQLKFISKHKSANKLAERLEEGSLKLLISREIKSHEKIYILKADDGRVRVITGSANLSYSAFNGIQRENITFMDNETAYEYYRDQFEQFKEECADNVEHKSMTRIIADPDSSVDDLVDIIPVAETVKIKKILILEESDNPEYIIAADASNISKDIKPLLPVKDKQGKTFLNPTVITNIKRKYTEKRETKQEERNKMPKLHIDVERKYMSFNDKELNLFPEKELVKADLLHFLEYMDGFDAFSGDVDKNRRTFFLFATWYLASPFMPYLRAVANSNRQDIKQFPVYAIVYGESNGGKTTFLQLLTKMMCGKKIPVNKNNDFTYSIIDRLKQECEGLPIVIDELGKTQYNNHISNIVKYDEWGLKENKLFYPAVAITTNEISSIKSDISKRVFVCHIDACLDKDKSRTNYKKVIGCLNEMTNTFYCEYVRRMMERIDNIVAQMKGADDTYLPDIFTESSSTIIEIASEYIDGELPSYMYACDYNDYFGNKAVGRNAIQKIRRAWDFERDAFKIHKKKGLLEYRIPENAGTYVIDHIRQELPPSLNAQVTSRTLTMDLAAASEFFGIDFKISFLEKIRRK